MCLVWQNPTRPEEEIRPQVLEKLPRLFFVNITGGEPFIRQDLSEIVEILRKKSERMVISTNGYFTDKIISLCKRYPRLGIRISIEGLAKANDEIRRIPDGFDRTLRTLLELKSMGIKDIGFAMTVQDLNFHDIVPLYLLAQGLGLEFATAVIHNSHYFHKWDNRIENKKGAAAELYRLINLLLKSKRPKEWFRAYFNYGLINYINGNRRLLPCSMARDGFFVDPWGDVLSCNGMDKKYVIGNLKEKTWDEIWNNKSVENARQKVKDCTRNCWMIGSAAPAIWRHPLRPVIWVLKNKLKQSLGKNNFC
jgi:MoaA/NifB/PqqE/SkfB family radical SAM enzyme